MTKRRYDTPPKNLTSLEARLRNVVADAARQNRARRQIGNIAVIAALTAHARDKNDQPLFVVKGGVAVELLMGLDARATQDLDAAVRATAEEIRPRLLDALAEGWDGFEFRLASWDPIHDTGAHRGNIKVSYRGKPFSTVQFEAAPAEGDAGQQFQLVGNSFVNPSELGLSPVNDMPLVTLAYMVAQKLHACTDHTVPNDRARDLIDILLVVRLLKADELAEVRHACAEIFALRSKQSWPPTVVVPDDWSEIYSAELASTPEFSPTDVHEAARAVDDLIIRIDCALSSATRRGAIRATAGALPNADDWEAWLASVRGSVAAERLAD
jgi:hypothetical protein